MVYDIVLGRNDSDRLKFGNEATIFLGKGYVRMGQTTSLSNRILLDVARTHVILVSGKRGSGKSTTLGVIAEEVTKLDEEIKNNLAFLFFDTMGIFWTMKYPNLRDEKLLKEWNLKPEKINVDIYVPKGYEDDYRKKDIPVDFSFSFKVNELNASDWASVFDVKLTSQLGVLIESVLDELKGDYSINDIIKAIHKDNRFDKEIRIAAENRFRAADKWGLFSRDGVKISDIVKSGKISIIDLSVYTNIAGNLSIKALVVGLVSRKLLNERIIVRKAEEISEIKESKSLLEEENKKEMPLVWIIIDEAQEFLPRDKKVASSDALLQLVREGRQPGISLVLATQQPGEIAKDVITQSDIVISHRLTARVDIEALNNIMQSYLIGNIQRYFNELPNLKGSAIILDDNSERIYPVRIRPKLSWHGGETPSAIKFKKRLLEDLKV